MWYKVGNTVLYLFFSKRRRKTGRKEACVEIPSCIKSPHLDESKSPFFLVKYKIVPLILSHCFLQKRNLPKKSILFSRPLFYKKPDRQQLATLFEKQLADGWQIFGFFFESIRKRRWISIGKWGSIYTCNNVWMSRTVSNRQRKMYASFALFLGQN